MYCKHCGGIIADDSKFCNYCGSSTENEELQEHEDVEKQHKESISVDDELNNNLLNDNSPDCNNKQSNNYGSMLGIALMTISLMTILVSIFLVIPMMAFRKGDLSVICVSFFLGICGYIIGKRIKSR